MRSITCFFLQGNSNSTNSLHKREPTGGGIPYPTGYPHPSHSGYPNHSGNSMWDLDIARSLGFGQDPTARPCEIHMTNRNKGYGCCRTRSLTSRFPSRAKRIDVISRFIFPLVFAIFNLTYWLYYLLAKGSNESFTE